MKRQGIMLLVEGSSNLKMSLIYYKAKKRSIFIDRFFTMFLLWVYVRKRSLNQVTRKIVIHYPYLPRLNQDSQEVVH